jgi:hypothetical protein
VFLCLLQEREENFSNWICYTFECEAFFFWVDWHRREDVGKAIFMMKRARKKLLGLAQEGVGWKGWKEKQSSAELLIVRNSFIL